MAREIFAHFWPVRFAFAGLSDQCAHVNFFESMLWKGTGFLAGILSESAKE